MALARLLVRRPRRPGRALPQARKPLPPPRPQVPQPRSREAEWRTRRARLYNTTTHRVPLVRRRRRPDRVRRQTRKPRLRHRFLRRLRMSRAAESRTPRARPYSTTTRQLPLLPRRLPATDRALLLTRKPRRPVRVRKTLRAQRSSTTTRARHLMPRLLLQKAETDRVLPLAKIPPPRPRLLRPQRRATDLDRLPARRLP